jgi:hypothetical protein
MKNPEYRDKIADTSDLAKLCAPVLRQERRFQRFSLHSEVQLRFQVGTEWKEITATSQNVSVGGFLLSTTTSLPSHTTVTFLMSIRATSLIRPVHLTGTGQIVRVQLVSAGCYAVAIECTTPIIQIEQYLPAIAFC